MFDARAIFDGPGPYYASALWQQHQVQRLAPDGAAGTDLWQSDDYGETWRA